MAHGPTPPGEPITDKTALIEYLQAGCTPESDWRIGTEHEKFPYHLSNLKPLTYDEENGIRRLLDGMTRFGWVPIMENNNIIALKKDDGCAITLEPAGQLELSGAPLENIHQTCDEVAAHLQQVKAIAREMEIGFLGLGYRPNGSNDDAPWMPKGRYKIMREYMPKKGNLGLEMMKSTCTVQVNLDFSTEEVMVEMFRVGLALQPIATALWANSPFKEGKPTGYLSYRSHIWTDTDPDRSGNLPFVFEDGFGFERYVDYILDVPMYFVYRDGKYVDASGQSFRDFLNGKLPALPGEYPVLSDWVDHLTTAFPEVRLKQYLEMRGADGGSWARLCALPAFWVGLLYDKEARSQACGLIADWTEVERDYLRDEVPRKALNTPFRGQTVREVNAKGFDTDVVLEPNGNVAEFCYTNLFLAKDGVVHTPAINGTFLNGITRQRVIHLLRDSGVEVHERAIDFAEVVEADELFGTGNYAKVVPCTRLEDRALQPGPLYRQARELYFQFSETT